MCTNAEKSRIVQISCDGLSECRSNTNSMDVYSYRFKNCNMVYPHTITRPLNKYKLDSKNYFKFFLQDLLQNECFISLFVGDNPKRAFVRYALCHSALYACEYCFAKGTSFKKCDHDQEQKILHLNHQLDTIEKTIGEMQNNNEDVSAILCIKEIVVKNLKDLKKTKSHVVWPVSTMDAEPRTKFEIENILDKINKSDNLTKDDVKGIYGRSPLLDIPYFDIVQDVPTEHLHTSCLGVTKRLIELTFNVGTNRQRITRRKLSSPAKFNKLMSTVKMFKEFSRRARALDFCVMKGQEFRNIALFFFLIVIECIEEKEQERKLWLLFAYMIRSCSIPQEEYLEVNQDHIHSSCRQFYMLYQKLFGEMNCSYNLHSLCSHLPNMRAHGPLSTSSAFGFENFYGEIRHSFVPGTTSPLKQILQKILLKRQLNHHQCAPIIRYSNYTTPMESNNLVYVYNELNQYEIYKINEIHEKMLSCELVEKCHAKFVETPNLKWDKVGVFRVKKDISGIPKKKTIEATKVGGKVIKVLDYLVTCPINVLEEK